MPDLRGPTGELGYSQGSVLTSTSPFGGAPSLGWSNEGFAPFPDRLPQVRHHHQQKCKQGLEFWLREQNLAHHSLEILQTAINTLLTPQSCHVKSRERPEQGKERLGNVECPGLLSTGLCSCNTFCHYFLQILCVMRGCSEVLIISHLPHLTYHISSSDSHSQHKISQLCSLIFSNFVFFFWAHWWNVKHAFEWALLEFGDPWSAITAGFWRGFCNIWDINRAVPCGMSWAAFLQQILNESHKSPLCTCVPAQGISLGMLVEDFQEITIVWMNLEVVTCLGCIIIGIAERKLSNTFKIFNIWDFINAGSEHSALQKPRCSLSCFHWNFMEHKFYP